MVASVIFLVEEVCLRVGVGRSAGRFQPRAIVAIAVEGLKTVRIFSTDRNTPRLDLTGMRRKDDIVPLIRGRVEYNKRKKGIYEITNH